MLSAASWTASVGARPGLLAAPGPLRGPGAAAAKNGKYEIQFSQVDAAFPLSGLDGPLRGVPYVMKAIAWADLAGSPCVDTTDGLHPPGGLTDEEAMDLMKRNYQQIIEVAERIGSW